MDYQTRLKHFTFYKDKGRFVVESERDPEFKRMFKIGPVISNIEERKGGRNGSEVKEQIHQYLYMPVREDYRKWKKGNAPDEAELAPYTDHLDDKNNNNNNGNK